nr:DNA helicase [Tanacetum cinerariifolium]
MRLIRPCLNEYEQKETQAFVAWLLDVGNGELGVRDEQDTKDTALINIPPEYCSPADEEGIAKLTDFIYDQEILKKPTTACLQERQSRLIQWHKNDCKIPNVKGHRSANHYRNKSRRESLHTHDFANAERS